MRLVAGGMARSWWRGLVIEQAKDNLVELMLYDGN